MEKGGTEKKEEQKKGGMRIGTQGKTKLNKDKDKKNDKEKKNRKKKRIGKKRRKKQQDKNKN